MELVLIIFSLLASVLPQILPLTKVTEKAARARDLRPEAYTGLMKWEKRASRMA